MASLTDTLKGIEAGGEELEFQYLSQSMTKAKQKVRPNKHQEVTFVTDKDVLNNGNLLGLIVWVDKDKFIEEAKK